ncbi:Os03g0236983, partial [Oryza sativa Japonica Group]
MVFSILIKVNVTAIILINNVSMLIYFCISKYDQTLMPFFQLLEALGCEEAEAEVAEELGGVEDVERAAEVAAQEERLREHVDVGGVPRGRGHLVGEEDGGRVQVLPDAVPHHPAQPLHRLLPHLRRHLPLRLRLSPPLGIFLRCGGGGGRRCWRETEFCIPHSP